MSKRNPKLPVVTTLGAAIRQTVQNAAGYGLLALPTFLFSLLSYYVQVSQLNYSISSGDFSRNRFDLITISLQIASLAFYVMLFANVVRRTLLGRAGPRNALGLGWGWREFRIVGRYVLVLMLMLLLLAPIFVLVVALISDKEAAAWLAFVPLVTLALVVFVSCRMLPYITAPSLDARLGLGDAFDSGKGNVLRIFACFLLLMLPYLVAWLVFAVTVGSPIDMAMLLMTRSFLAVIVFNFIGLTWTVFSMVLVALIYEHLVLVPAAEENLSEPAVA